MFSYNKATLYGNSLTDYIHIGNKIDTQNEINATLGYEYEPKWNSETVLFAPFTDGINGGNIVSLTDNVLFWQIYRKQPNDSILTFLYRVPVTQYSLLDFNILNNSEYQYVIFAETENYISAPMEQKGYTKAVWGDWSICGLIETESKEIYNIDENNIWLFNSNLESGTIEQNLDKYTMENFTKFPKISSGKKNYLTGSIKALLGNVNPQTNEYSDTVEMYNRFVDFIADGNEKLLRDRKGNGWIVSTTGNNLQYIDYSADQMTNVTFSFTQINDTKNFTIIGG